MIKPKFYLFITVLATLVACGEKDENLETYDLKGVAQKGPFLVGADVSIIELNSDLNPTGRTYDSKIEDNSGKFVIPEVDLASSFVKVKVEGQAYDEVVGAVPYDEISLSAIADLSDNNEVNVNVATDIVAGRLGVLAKSGIAYEDAKVQAQKELLSVFELQEYYGTTAEKLDLTKADSDGGLLLLLSSLIQSNSSSMTLQEFLTNMQTDFKLDGEINSEDLQEALKTSAQVLKVSQIKNNLKSRYAEMGLDFDFYDFQPLLTQFLDNSPFPSLLDGVFPETADNSINLLAKHDTVYVDKSSDYVMRVDRLSNNELSSIQIEINSESNSFTTSGADFYDDGNTHRLMVDMMAGAGVNVPVTFTGEGQMDIKLYILGMGSGMMEYPVITVMWE